MKGAFAIAVNAFWLGVGACMLATGTAKNEGVLIVCMVICGSMLTILLIDAWLEGRRRAEDAESQSKRPEAA